MKSGDFPGLQNQWLGDPERWVRFPSASANRAMTFNYAIWELIKPSQLILLAAIVGVVFWRTGIGRFCRSAAVLMILAFGLLPTAAFLMRPLETRYPIPAGLGSVDGIVVLAGAERTEISESLGQLQLDSSGDRLTTFLRLANEYPSARLVYSGARQAGAASELILGAGIDPGRIEFDDRSRDTCDSARYVPELAGPAEGETWLLVTSAFHMPRSMACFRAEGWDIVPYPTDFRRGANPWHFGLLDNLEDLDLAAHEWLGLAYYRIRGRTDALLPPPAQ